MCMRESDQDKIEIPAFLRPQFPRFRQDMVYIFGLDSSNYQSKRTNFDIGMFLGWQKLHPDSQTPLSRYYELEVDLRRNNSLIPEDIFVQTKQCMDIRRGLDGLSILLDNHPFQRGEFENLDGKVMLKLQKGEIIQNSK